MERIILLTESELHEAILKALAEYMSSPMPYIPRAEINIPDTLEDLDLSARAFNCLKAAQINSTAELLGYSEHQLRQYRNFGDKSIREIKAILNEYNLKLKY